MSTRPISRLVTTALAAGAISVAMSVPAMAGSADFYYGASGIPTAVSGGDTHPNVTAGTDVASPDQQAPIPAAKSTPTAIPKPVAQPASPSAASDFQWDDAGIGAGGALVIVLTALGGVMLVRRRHVADPPLPA
jgi:hypothetical protein